MEGYFKTIASTLMHVSLQCMSADATAVSSTSQPEVKHAITNMILHNSYPKCSTVDFSSQRLVCGIWDEDDENTLQHLGECHFRDSGMNVRRPVSCPDASTQKICVPEVGDPDVFLCACKSLKKEPVDVDYVWDAEWRDVVEPRQGLYRKLCNQATWSCVAAEYKYDLAHLVKYTHLPDDKITASSSYDAKHNQKRARIDNYFSYPCGWAATMSDSNIWVGFDLILPQVGIGILLIRRCDPGSLQAVTKFRVGVSNDTSLWQYSENIMIEVNDYGKTESTDHLSFTHWFPEPYIGRFWRIYILEYAFHPTLKADIIGKI